MKLLNIILSILILALAGTALYFAQQVHVKRYQVKIRGDEIASSIQKVVKGYDDVLGLKFKDKIKTEDLTHAHDGAEIAQTLRPLAEQYSKFASYQAETLDKTQKLMKTIDMESAFDIDKASKAKSIDEVATALPEATAKLRERNEGIVEKSIAVGARFNISIDEEKLNNIDDFMLAKADFDSMNENADKFFAQLADYEKNLNDIADFFKQEPINFGDENKNEVEGPYIDALKNIISTAQKVPSEISSTKSDIESLSSEITTNEESSKSLDEKIKALKTATAGLEKNIEDLRAFLTQEWPSVKPWKYHTITVNIIDVNDEGTRLTLDWSKNFKFNDELIPPLASEFVVALAGDHKGVNNFGRIFIDSIEDNKAYARIITMPSIVNNTDDVYYPHKQLHVDFVQMPLLVFDATKTLETVYRNGNAKILKISPDSTFVVVNWGKNFKVQQAATNNRFPAPMIGKYDLTASTPSSSKPSARLSVMRIEDDYSIANIATAPTFKDENGNDIHVREGDNINLVPAFIPDIELETAKIDFERRKQANTDDAVAVEESIDEEVSSKDETPEIVEEVINEEITPEEDAVVEETKTVTTEVKKDSEISVVKAPIKKEKKGFWASLFSWGDEEISTEKAPIVLKDTVILETKEIGEAKGDNISENKSIDAIKKDEPIDEKEIQPATEKQIEKKSETVNNETQADEEKTEDESDPTDKNEPKEIDEEKNNEDIIIVPEEDDEEETTVLASHKANVNNRKSEVITVPSENKE